MKYLYIFIISMLPLIELRGAILFAIGSNMNLFISSIICILANILVMPFIFFFAKKVLNYLMNIKKVRKIANYILKKGHLAGEKIISKSNNGIYIAIMLFVGIPMPGTGVYTGTLAASLLDLDFKKTFIANVFGVIIANILMILVFKTTFNIFI